jgi:hypothetical protein
MRGRPCHKKQGYNLTLIFLIWIIWASGCATSATPTADEKDGEKGAPVPHHILKDIRVVDTRVHFELVRSGTKNIYYTAFKDSDPLRIVVDLPDTVAGNVSSSMAVENEIIGEIRTITLGDESKPITRVEITLRQDTAYLIDEGHQKILITFLTDQQLLKDAADQGEPVVLPEAEESNLEEKAGQEVETPKVSAHQPVPLPLVDEETLPLASEILAIELVAMEEDFDVHIIGNGRFKKYDVSLLPDPPRLVVDLPGIKATKVKDVLTLNLAWAEKIRVVQHSGKVRVVFDLTFTPKREFPFQLNLKENLLVVSLTSGG